MPRAPSHTRSPVPPRRAARPLNRPRDLCCPAPAPQALGLKDITKRHWRIVECSAHTGEGLLEGFEWIVKDISSRIYCFSE
jgi:hypothetical protein